MTTKPDYYALLGLSPECTEEEVKRAYHEAALRIHPDVNRRPGATELFLGVQEAYEVLSDNQRRATYDTTLPPKPETPAPFTIEIEYSRPAIWQIYESQLLYALVHLSTQTPESPPPAVPLNLCLILDRSTSMQGERIDTLKSASISLIRQLSSKDTISVVTFSDRSEGSLHCRPANGPEPPGESHSPDPTQRRHGNLPRVSHRRGPGAPTCKPGFCQSHHPHHRWTHLWG